MDFLEKNLEEIIYDSHQAGEHYTLWCRGFNFIGPGMYSARQYKLPGYGIVDLVFVNVFRIKDEDTKHGQYFDVEIYVCELKKGEIDFNALGQVYRYKQAFEKLESSIHPDDSGGEVRFSVYPVLIGSKVNINSDLVYVLPALDDLLVYTYHYGLNGLTLKNETGIRYTPNAADLSSLLEQAKAFPLHNFLFNKASERREALKRFMALKNQKS